MQTSGEQDRSLASLERWFQDEVVRPQERGKRSSSGGSPAPAREWILPSAYLKPAERVALYSGMYFLRMRDALLADFPALARLVMDSDGERGFERLVRGYVTKHPSRHYSLNFLGAKFPEYLDGPVRIPRRALLADIARLELAMTEVFDEAPSPVLAPADLARVSPETWAQARPRLIAALRVLALEHRANAIVTAARKQETLPPLVRKKTWVVVWRKEWVVWRMEIDEPAFAALRKLREGGTLRAAIEAAARTFQGSQEELEQQIFRWFSGWVSEGFFSAVD